MGPAGRRLWAVTCVAGASAAGGRAGGGSEEETGGACGAAWSPGASCEGPEAFSALSSSPDDSVRTFSASSTWTCSPSPPPSSASPPPPPSPSSSSSSPSSSSGKVTCFKNHYNYHCSYEIN